MYFIVIITKVNLSVLPQFHNASTQILLLGNSIALFQSKHKSKHNSLA